MRYGSKYWLFLLNMLIRPSHALSITSTSKIEEGFDKEKLWSEEGLRLSGLWYLNTYLASRLLCGVVSSSLCYRILRRPYHILVSSIDLDPAAVFTPVAYFFDTFYKEIPQSFQQFAVISDNGRRAVICDFRLSYTKRISKIPDWRTEFTSSIKSIVALPSLYKNNLKDLLMLCSILSYDSYGLVGS